MKIRYKNKHFNKVYGFDPFAAIPWKGGLLVFFICIAITIAILTGYNHSD